MQCRAGVIPYAVFVGSFDTKYVISGIEIGVSSKVTRGIGIDPGFVKAFKLINEFVAQRIAKVQSGKLYRKSLLSG